MDLSEKFTAAAARAKALPKAPPTDALLDLYAFYKQATVGDVEGKRPGMLDFKGQAKFDAWARRKSMSQEQAMQAYVDLVDKLAK